MSCGVLTSNRALNITCIGMRVFYKNTSSITLLTWFMKVLRVTWCILKSDLKWNMCNTIHKIFKAIEDLRLHLRMCDWLNEIGICARIHAISKEENSHWLHVCSNTWCNGQYSLLQGEIYLSTWWSNNVAVYSKLCAK